MNILTFDTSLDKSYLALSSKGEILSLEVVDSDEEKYHSAYLISNIVKILKNNKLRVSDIDIIGVNTGPGSFTGIRACVTAARILGQQSGIKVAGIPSLEILSLANKTDKTALIAMDARKNMAYAAIYKGKQVIKAPSAVSLEELIALAQENFFFIADNKITEILAQQNRSCLNYQGSDLPLGQYLVELTEAYTKKESYDFSWQNLKPHYIQPPPITMTKK